MAKLFRFSGFYLDEGEFFGRGSLRDELSSVLGYRGIRHLNIEESNHFDSIEGLDEECDLTELSKHFKNEEFYMSEREVPEPGQKYRHFKLDKVVTILGIARHTETEEVEVVYEHDGHIWCRPIQIFMSEVDKEKYPDAKQQFRFELVEGNSEEISTASNTEYSVS